MAITRTVTVYDQNTQEKTVIENVSVETFGELKSVLRQKGINLEGMDVREGISRVDLKSDSAVLPHDTPYKGSTTNDLMILITKTNKKVSSGAMGRAEASEFIKKNNLQQAVKDRYGKNWTNVSTAELVSFVQSWGPKPASEPSEQAKPEEGKECPVTPLVEAFKKLLKVLHNDETIEEDDYYDILKALEGGAASTSKSDKGFSQDEIWDAIRDM